MQAEALAPVDGAAPARRMTALERAAVIFLVAFLVVFPKGGVKAGGVPITWGYLGLGLVSLSFPLLLLLGRRLRVLRSRLWVLAALLPFQVVVWGTLLVRGYLDTGFAVSLVTTVIFIPLALVLFLGIHLDRIHLPYLFRLLRWGIFFIAAYGIFLFVYKMTTGKYVEIPYLTVNAADLGTLGDKHNNRGGVWKLISTYNNGNLYGISVMLLFPLYSWMERSALCRSVVKISILLSLSRTVWVGLVLHELAQRLYVRRPGLRTVLLLAASLAAVLGGVVYALHLLGRDPSFLLDRSLGGRQAQWSSLDQTTLWAPGPFVTILEITYLSVLNSFGIGGLATFLLGFTLPLLLHLAGCTPFGSTPYKRSIAASLAIYLVISAGDGGLLFIPVGVFYWFMVSLLLSDNPSFAAWQAKEQRPARPPREAPRLVEAGV